MDNTWKTLQRKGYDAAGEVFSEYYERVSRLFPNIPREVLEQWLYPHSEEEEMTQNYGWLNFNTADFTLESWPTEQILPVNVSPGFLNWVKSNEESDIEGRFRTNSGRPEVVKSWQEKGTWFVPPIILITDGLVGAPSNAYLKPPIQLVEGHTRFGWLLNFWRHQGGYSLASEHELWVMRQYSRG